VIATWSKGQADDGMDQGILTELTTLIHRHPWWKARSRLTLALLDQLGVARTAEILDAGCGWGTTLLALEQAGFRVTGMDVSRRMLDKLDHPERRLIEADLSQPLPAGAPSFDVVLALDVIEHIDHDQEAVGRLGQLLRSGGVLVVSVPALPDLFGEFDRIQGHRRRYLPESLRAAFLGSGLLVERLLWWGQWMVPLLRRQRRNGRVNPGETVAQGYARYLRVGPWPLGALMGIAFAWEESRALAGRLRTGTSLIAVARRPL
jgi:2-polyprenyl-3-methyl-5-hydroxy-6-metoxy-1,4-benzoquinol methylase